MTDSSAPRYGMDMRHCGTWLCLTKRRTIIARAPARPACLDAPRSQGPRTALRLYPPILAYAFSGSLNPRYVRLLIPINVSNVSENSGMEMTCETE